MFRLYASFIIPFTVWPLVVNLLSLKPIPPPGLFGSLGFIVATSNDGGVAACAKIRAAGAQQNA